AGQPTRTVGQPITMTPPWAVMSPSRAAGMPLMSTVNEATATTSGPPAQTHMSVARAAGMPPISTGTAHGGMIGPPTCGTTPVTIGQTCGSVRRAAGIPMSDTSLGYSVPPAARRGRRGRRGGSAGRGHRHPRPGGRGRFPGRLRLLPAVAAGPHLESDRQELAELLVPLLRLGCQGGQYDGGGGGGRAGVGGGRDRLEVGRSQAPLGQEGGQGGAGGLLVGGQGRDQADALGRPPDRLPAGQGERQEPGRVRQVAGLVQRLDVLPRGVLRAEQLPGRRLQRGGLGRLRRRAGPGQRVGSAHWTRHGVPLRVAGYPAGQLIIVSPPLTVSIASPFTWVISPLTSVIICPSILTIIPLMVTPIWSTLTLLWPT